MPRTKQVRKKTSIASKKKSVRGSVSSISSAENDSEATLFSQQCETKEHFKEEFNKYYNKKVGEYEKSYEAAREEVKKMMSDLMDSFPHAVKLKNISCIKEDFSDQNKDPNVKRRSSLPRSESAESFSFKKPKTPAMTRKMSRKRSVSASAVSSASRSNDGFKTPQMSSRKFLSNKAITPKVYNDTPISMMRRPLQGEVAVSMSGSPLMVSAIASEDIPTVNVPLQDGRVFSIMPEPGAPPPDFPQIDEATKQYLKTLRAHLEILAPNSP